MTAAAKLAFYHLTRSALLDALPALLARALASGMTVKITTPDDAAAHALNTALWTYQPDSFLPHCLADEPCAAQTPVVISAGDERPNAARVLILTGGAQRLDLSGWGKLLYLFDGEDDVAVAAARSYWRTLADGGMALDYWRQDDSGWTLAQSKAGSSGNEAGDERG